MNKEQSMEIECITKLMKDAKEVKNIEINGKQYVTFITETIDTIDKSSCMRVIVGKKSWSILPAIMPIEKGFLQI